MIKDILSKSIFSLLTLLYIWYCVVVYQQWIVYTQPYLIWYMTIVLIILMLIVLIHALHASWIQYHLTTKFKLLHVFLGVILMSIAHYGLVDNLDQWLYLRDITIVYAIVIIITWLLWWTISSATIKKLEDQKIQIIEV